MDRNYLRMIRCGEIEIAASCEDRDGNVMEAYLPSNVLFYMQTGQLNIEVDGNSYVVPKNNFGLLRKHTHCKFHKSWSSHESSAKTYGFVLTNEYLKKALKKLISFIRFSLCN